MLRMSRALRPRLYTDAPRTCALPELSPSCILWDVVMHAQVAGEEASAAALGRWCRLRHLLSTRSQSVARRVVSLVRARSQLHRTLLAFHGETLHPHSIFKAGSAPLPPPHSGRSEQCTENSWVSPSLLFHFPNVSRPEVACAVPLLLTWVSSNRRTFYTWSRKEERKTTGGDFRRWFRCPVSVSLWNDRGKMFILQLC